MVQKWDQKIVMPVIVKRLSMETAQDEHTFERRSFFLRLFGGIAGGWVAGKFFSGMVRTIRVIESNEVVQVKINPLAVSRSNKDAISHD
jgi:hypothetical protein